MWIIELTFSGDPAQRLAARPAHRERLAALHADGVVRLAGPVAGDTAAFILLDVEDRAGADAVLAADPYYSTPGVEVSRVIEWQPVIG